MIGLPAMWRRSAPTEATLGTGMATAAMAVGPSTPFSMYRPPVGTDGGGGGETPSPAFAAHHQPEVLGASAHVDGAQARIPRAAITSPVANRDLIASPTSAARC